MCFCRLKERVRDGCRCDPTRAASFIGTDPCFNLIVMALPLRLDDKRPGRSGLLL